MVSSALFLHLEASRLTYFQRSLFNYFSVDFLAWQLILSDLSRSAARYRITTRTISKFQTTGNGLCVFCAFPYVYMTINRRIWISMFVFRLYRQCLFGCRYWCGAVFWEEARNSVQRGTASFSWHLLAIEQCRKKKGQKISLGNYFSQGKFCIKVLFKMTGLLKYLYQSCLIKIDISLSLLVKRAL